MSTEDLRDKHGRLLGKIKEVNGEYVLRDANGRLVGKYNPKINVTTDRNGKLIGRGNLLASLLGNK